MVQYLTATSGRIEDQVTDACAEPTRVSNLHIDADIEL